MNIKSVVVVMGRSGTGKSSSIRSLDPSSTAIINTEFKPLPFKGGSRFTNMVVLEKPEDIFIVLKAAKDNEKIKTVVIDSFTQWSNDLVAYCEKTEKGFDRQNLYNTMTHDFFSCLKRLGKDVFIMCHEELETTSEGEVIKQAKVEYKRKKGIVEESALVMVYSTIKYDENRENPRYVFQTQPDPVNPAKAPLGMFDEKFIDNDLNLVLSKMHAYFEGEQEPKRTAVKSNPEIEKLLGKEEK